MNHSFTISVRRRPGSTRRLAALGLVTLGVVALATSGVTAGATSNVPSGTVTSVGKVPNTFASSSNLPNTTAVMMDSVNRLIFQYNAVTKSPCPQLVSMDMDTFSVRATQPCGTGSYGFLTAAPAGGPVPPNMVIDPVDRVIIALTSPQGDDRFDNVPLTNRNELMVISEDTLKLIGYWYLPSTITARTTQGVSWYQSSDKSADELIVLSSNGAQGSSLPGIDVSAYDIRKALASTPATPSSTQLAAIWDEPPQSMSACSYALTPAYNSAGAYHGNAAVYVPCQLFHGNFSQFGASADGVVKIPLTGSGDSEKVDTSSKLVSAAAPGMSNDFYFDAGKDRGFMPLTANGRASALVYDGKTASFMGKIDLGQDEVGSGTANGAIIGLDQATGRIYALDAEGLTLVDGRRTPVAPGITLSQFANPNVSSGSTVVLPPDSRNPYTRLLGPDMGDNNTMPDFFVYADTIPVTEDPPKGQVDNNTHNGPIAPDATVTKLTGGSARGYGFHLDFVSGYQGVIDDAQPFHVQGLPFGSGNRDLLGSFIDHVSLGSDALQGQASALGDGNNSTMFDYQSCTNVYVPSDCASILNSSYCQPPVGPPPSPCPTPPAVPTSSPSGSPSPTPTTRQQWPFPVASCYYNKQAQSGNAFQDRTGFNATSTDGTTSMVTDSDQAATAHVDCSGSTVAKPSTASLSGVAGAAQASSFLRLFKADPLVEVAGASSSAYVIPATATSPTEAHLLATVHGFSIDVPGEGTLSIGTIEHDIVADSNGIAGSAKTTNTVTISQVSITSPIGPFTCGQCDPQTVLDQINAAFPYVLHAYAPTADAPFGFATDKVSPNGSPGGYSAVVQADGAEQFGDQQFNDMRAEEASMLPAFRIVMYGVNDGTPNLSRLVMDAAGGEVDTETGLQAQDAFGDFPTTDIPNVPQAAIEAGVPMSSIGGNIQQPGGGGATPGTTSGPGGPLGVLMSTLSGLAWLGRSPGAAAQMAAFLSLLGLPLVLLRRRWMWSVEDSEGESQ